MAELFQRNRSVIGRHVRNIFKEGELNQGSTCAKFAQVQKEGNRYVERSYDYFNLDVIISVGYREKSQRGIEFREVSLS
ncbi:MAG: virulence RhuM family protein [Faecalicoccus sp.]|nr:virulence RhuM family protein [Faecalicoccus sp.]